MEVFSGYMDEIRIYNHALISGEIENLYRSNFAKYDTDSWKFSYQATGLELNS
jgi:hypothetical protein